MKNRKMPLLSLLSVILVFSSISPACAPSSAAITDSVLDGSSATPVMVLNTPRGNVTPMVATGYANIVGLRSDGTVVAVGPNHYGECDVGGWTDIVQIAASHAYGHHTVGLKSDGTVVAVGDNSSGQCDVGDWTDIVQVAAGFSHTMGLKSGGTVVAVGDNSSGQCDVGDWTDIVQVVGGSHTVGLKSDGTVVATGADSNGQCNVGGWTDIVEVAAGCAHTVGLKSDGTVVAVGWNSAGQLNVGGWIGIIQIAAGAECTVGLKPDGTAVAVGSLYWDACNVAGWTDIVQVAAGLYHTVGLKSDGTVVAAGYDIYGQCNVGGWTTIVQVAAGGLHTVGLESDGTVVAVGPQGGYEDYQQCDVGDWTDIVQVAAGSYHTVGLKSDGTVVAVGSNYSGACDVSNWTDIIQVAAGSGHTVGLNSDGTVVATDYSNYYVAGWTDIVQVAAGGLFDCHTVGLKSDGTAVATTYDVGGWTDIVQVAAGGYHMLGVKSDGTVVAVGDNSSGQCDVGDWTDIVQVDAGSWHTVGLRSDGTVVAVGNNDSAQCNVGAWTDIVQVAAGHLHRGHTVGLKSDGTVAAAGLEAELAKWNLLETAPPSDTTPPTVSSVSPEGGDTNVSVDTVITATFSEPMDSSTTTTDSFTLAGSTVAGTVAYDPATRTATFTPDAALDYNHTYTASLSTAITDLAGNPLAESYTWSFTTQSEPDSAWSFAIITDMHIGRGYPDYGGQGWSDAGSTGEPYYLTARLERAVQTIIDLKDTNDIRFAVVLGDITDSAECSEYDKAKAILSRLDEAGIPYVPIIGNHDVWPYTHELEADYPWNDYYFRNIFIKQRLGLLDGFFDDWESPFTAKEVTWFDPDLPGQRTYTASLQNFAFTYGSVNFICLDCVAREPFPLPRPLGPGVGADAVLWPETKTWLTDHLCDNSTTILFSHHPMIADSLLAFESDELDQIAEAINSSGSNVVADFAGHVHGYYSPDEWWSFGIKNPKFMDANLIYTDLAELGTGTSVVTTEALMVASNEETAKGIIRIVKVDDDDITVPVEAIAESEYTALNPYFKGISWEPVYEGVRLISPSVWRVWFELYAYNKLYPIHYTLDFDDDKPLGAIDAPGGVYPPVVINHNYPKEGGTYTVELTASKGLESESITGTVTLPQMSWVINLLSPCDIVVTDPDGLTVSKELSEIPGAHYFENDVDGNGDLDDTVVFAERKAGDYLVTVLPEPGTSPTDTYTLAFVGEDGDVLLLADEVQIGDVPSGGYTVRSTEDGFMLPTAGCFIATAAYGTPMAEEVQILRDFRDDYLLTTPLGQAFVDLYYSVSPPIAEFISEHPSLKPIVRAGLVPAVALSAVMVNTTVADKLATVGLLALVSVATAAWATRRRKRWPECS